jgi:hypothetical protein
MSDRDMRTRARAVQAAPDSEEAQSRDLAARLRAGTILPKHLGAAALLGYIPARAVLGGTGAWCKDDTHKGTGVAGCPRRAHHHHDDSCLRAWPDAPRWIRFVAGLGWRVAARAACALTEAVIEDARRAGWHSVPRGTPELLPGDLSQAASALDIARLWLTRDCRDYPSEFTVTPHELERKTRAFFRAFFRHGDPEHTWYLASLALAARPLNDLLDPNPGKVRCTDRDFLALTFTAANNRVNRDVRRLMSQRSLMEAVGERLIPWLLAGAPNE